jgi:hypothetical protein
MSAHFSNQSRTELNSPTAEPAISAILNPPPSHRDDRSIARSGAKRYSGFTINKCPNPVRGCPSPNQQPQAPDCCEPHSSPCARSAPTSLPPNKPGIARLRTRATQHASSPPNKPISNFKSQIPSASRRLCTAVSITALPAPGPPTSPPPTPNQPSSLHTSHFSLPKSLRHAARPSSGLRATTPGRFITCV